MTNGYGAHGAICLASSRASYTQSLSVLRNLGTLVCIGLANEDLPISPFQMIIRGINVAGSSVGTKQELTELMEMVTNGEVKPTVHVYDFERLDTVLQMLKDNVVGGRFVVMLP